ncbi:MULTISPECIES: Rgg/GadR/MutR family transcriptional regulator [Pseudolactococcus]|uniref:Rgg family transcriptional regulator n=1 Tax=Pseudolactococcus piscium MKFS47 TaxID=297352 RepID=A0A0D6DVZ3_9LACT|nr:MULTISPECIES: Rgg/GadR/MutR family transcriptional regulator [Lactococcus]MCJ1971710.1 helix-turn-helix domain-containing protein [Lactococcus carnosus]CEN28130.1 Rgg family transcriptional regulator [Lactococcus piscium MKFS47]
MVYKKYGQVFRKLRKQRGLPLIYFEPLGISKAALAKFERGETMMSFERLTLALQSLDVSLEEFEHHLNHFSLSNLEAISDDIFDLSIRGEQQALSTLSQELAEDDQLILSLTARYASYNSEFKSLSSSDGLDHIRDFLYKIELWGYYELHILFHTVFHLESEEVIYLFNRCLIYNPHFFNIPKYRTKLLDLGYRAANVLISRGDQDGSLYLLNRIDSYQVHHTMANQNFKNLTIGFWTYRFEDAVSGRQQMTKCVERIKEIETPDMAEYICQAFKTIINT